MLIPGTEIPIELHEIVILGTGLAGMAAAVAARQAGAEVLVLDKAPVTARSGNTRYSGGGFRAAHDGYDEDAVFADHLKITQGRANRELVETMIVESRETAEWLERLGVKWAHPDDRPDAAGYIWRFFYGGGQGMIEDLVAIAERLGVEIRYEHAGTELLLDGRSRVVGVRVQTPEGLRDFRADAVILATGGFQANPEMRVRYLGRFADALIVRGTRYNTGDGIRMALDAGAAPGGQFGDYHSAIMELRSDPVECGETNINTYRFGLIVDVDGERFVDEGADFFDVTYVRYGKLLYERRESRGALVFDAEIKRRNLIWCLKHGLEPYCADTLEEVAALLRIDPAGLRRTVDAYNAAVRPGTFDPGVLDGLRTEGVEPPKSNWALKIETPPFYAYSITGGITFTFGGLKVNKRAEVIGLSGKPIPGLYAAGEILGEFFYYSYPGGASLVRSAVFGRIAGAEAAAMRQPSPP